MNFRRYLNKIQRKTEVKQDTSKEIKTEVKQDTSKEIKTETKKILSFVDPDKNPHEYIKRYLNRSKS